MKILLVIDNLGSGGAQRQIVTLGVGLVNAGHDVDLLSYSSGDHFKHILRNENIRHIFINKKSYNHIRFFNKVSLFMRNGKYSIICAFMIRPSFIVLISKFLRSSFPKVILSERSYSVANTTDIVTYITRMLYLIADGIVVNSVSHFDFLMTTYKRYAKRFHYIPNGVDTRHFSMKKHSFNDGNLTILSIGHLNENKNAKCLIEAVNILSKQYKIDLEVNWLGRDFGSPGTRYTYADECYALVHKYHLSHIWNWEGVRQNVTHYLSRADVLVHAAYGEGFPNVICEALSVGCPVVASNVCDHPHIIKDGYNGFLFNPCDPAELAQKLYGYNTISTEEKMNMSNNAKATFRSKFTHVQMVRNYQSLFAKILLRPDAEADFKPDLRDML